MPAGLHEQTPSQLRRERVNKIIVFGVLVPATILLLLQTTRYSLFPGKADVLWAIIRAGVWFALIFNVVDAWLDRRRAQREDI